MTRDLLASRHGGNRRSPPTDRCRSRVSAADRRVIVIRNGIEIGRAAVAIDDPQLPLGTHAFIVKAGEVAGESLRWRGAAARNWMAMDDPRVRRLRRTRQCACGGCGRMHIPQDFAHSIYPLLAPGTTLLILDAPVLEENTGTTLTVMGSGNPNPSR